MRTGSAGAHKHPRATHSRPLHQTVDRILAVPRDSVSMSHQLETMRRFHHLRSFANATERSTLWIALSVRQDDRLTKVLMLTALYLDTTTQMIETIWPLSAFVQSRHPNMCSRQPSKMELRYFVQEVLKRSKASYSTLQVALYYLVLIQPHVPKHDFTQEQPESSASSFSLQCGRRMFISALILASKYLQDRNFSASGWSKISGLSTWDLNVNEMAFLTAIDWKLHVTDYLFNRWTDIVLKFSPSRHLNGPRSIPRPRLSWKEVVLRLTPELNSIDSDLAELSDDSGYCSPGSDMSPPPVPLRDVLISRSNENTPTPTPTPSTSVPQWLAQTTPISHLPSETNEQRPMLPPLLNHLAPLPTPDLTPQTNPFSTPAVSALGAFSRRSSMSRAMCQIQEAANARCCLDRTSEWKPRIPEGFPTLARRTSLASSTTISSPDSMSDASSQYSDTSSRPSRSSSISSVASSTCAPVQPTRLAVQAARRCATMQLSNDLKDAMKSNTIPESSTQSTWAGDEDTTPRANNGIQQPSPSPSPSSQPIPYPSNTSFPPKSSRKLPLSFPATSVASDEDQFAACALQDLALNSQLPHLQRADNRKRARPNSMDLSVEDAVRQIIAPRCLADITNSDTPAPSSSSAVVATEEAVQVVSDEEVADSFLLRKENKHGVRDSKRKTSGRSNANANARRVSSARNFSGSKTAQSQKGADHPPRKRTCAGSERGGRGEARIAMAEVSPSSWSQ